MFSYKEISRAVGVKKPQKSQQAKALWAMKAAKDRREEFFDPAREEDISRRKKRGWCCGKNISRIQLMQSIEVRGKSVLKLARGCVFARQQ